MVGHNYTPGQRVMLVHTVNGPDIPATYLRDAESMPFEDWRHIWLRLEDGSEFTVAAFRTYAPMSEEEFRAFMNREGQWQR